jgi:hypothetical protein
VNSAGRNRPSAIRDVTPEIMHEVAGIQPRRPRSRYPYPSPPTRAARRGSTSSPRSPPGSTGRTRCASTHWRRPSSPPR